MVSMTPRPKPNEVRSPLFTNIVPLTLKPKRALSLVDCDPNQFVIEHQLMIQEENNVMRENFVDLLCGLAAEEQRRESAPTLPTQFKPSGQLPFTTAIRDAHQQQHAIFFGEPDYSN
jgi:hypothetical protein